MSNDRNKVCDPKRYFAIALDPVYVGTGGYRIGRVDNTIVRDPGTNIPKIPATSLEGCCRYYAYLKAIENELFGGNDSKNHIACAKGKEVKEKIKNKENRYSPCGNCVICITFGYSKKDESHQALALFTDARIFLFPVATMMGPVWVTCPMILKELNKSLDKIDNLEDDEFIVPKESKIEVPENKLNFGWLLLNKKRDDETSHHSINVELPDKIKSRIVIVSNTLFPVIVNSNLEVRTSVAIDPRTGAAEQKALFTYEAIPRGTVFYFDVIIQNPDYFPNINKIKINDWGKEGNPNMETIKTTVEKGLSCFEYLGIGGMGSRGFGRIKILNLSENKGESDDENDQ